MQHINDYISEKTHCVIHINLPRNEINNSYIKPDDYHVMSCLYNSENTELLDIHNDGTEIYKSNYGYEKLYIIHPTEDSFSSGLLNSQTVFLPNHTEEDCCWNK